MFSKSPMILDLSAVRSVDARFFCSVFGGCKVFLLCVRWMRGFSAIRSFDTKQVENAGCLSSSLNIHSSRKVSVLNLKMYSALSQFLATVRVFFPLLVFKCQHFASKVCLKAFYKTEDAVFKNAKLFSFEINFDGFTCAIFVVCNYRKMDTCKFSSSQKHESGNKQADSSNACHEAKAGFVEVEIDTKHLGCDTKQLCLTKLSRKYVARFKQRDCSGYQAWRAAFSL